MSTTTQPPETDLLVPRPEAGEQWDLHTIHTHYFGFNIPEHAIGTFAYIRYMPAIGISHAGFMAYQGMDNLTLVDCLHSDYNLACPYPEADGNAFSANGLTFDFVEPGRVAQITYRSLDGRCEVDVRAEAVTPLAARGHVIPGEEQHTTSSSGGSEQFMHYTGELRVGGETYAVDCHAARDRSWRQVREEKLEANAHPPVMWTPVYFGPDLAINQVGWAAPDTDPLWSDAFDLPEGAPTHHFAWVSVDGEVRNVVRVRRRDVELHPQTLAPLKTEIEAEDETGATYTLRGEAIGFAPLPAWFNIAAYETLFRWEDEQGRVAHGPGQAVWNHVSQRAMRAKAAALAAT
ncbi:MAG TPA: tyrosine protein kinase [Solirubrobacteraceae bacterium]